MEQLVVRPADPRDVEGLARMFHDLWPDATADEHARDLIPVLAGQAPGTLPAVVFVAQAGSRLIGFLHAGLRSHADGCDAGRPVGYIEGWYVDPGHRHRKVGAHLVAAAEQWARSQGCVEIASDTWLDNLGSQRAHEALGYQVVDRCVNYRKRL